MTATRLTVGHSRSLSTARQVMRDHHVRHLPVLDGGRIVGIVSERDLLLLEAANRAVFSPRRFVTQLLRGSDVAATAHFDERVGIERAPSSYEELS